MYGVSQYGVFKYSEEQVNSDDIKILTPDLMRYLPWYYQEINEFKEIQNTVADELGMIAYHKESVVRQFLVDTATWGLEIHEKELGIETKMSLSFEERREIIRAKLRGNGTTTKIMIKNTAEAFTGGEVNVIEYPEDEYFVVQFIGVKGIPRNMQGFIDMLEMIKPAHLAYEFKYTYTVWNMLNQLVWENVGSHTWNELKTWEG